MCTNIFAWVYICIDVVCIYVYLLTTLNDQDMTQFFKQSLAGLIFRVFFLLDRLPNQK